MNYILNRNYVFRSERKALFRYLVLCTAVASASAASVFLLSRLIPAAPIWTIICDTVLFFASYRIQKTWVFAEDKSDRGADREKEEKDGA